MIERLRLGGKRLFAPEVIQTSAMDCGPAALSCLLEGFGVTAGYEGLQQACQTDLDGTSINTLEEIAVALGLDAEQMMVPADHLLLDSARTLPAIAVVKRERTTHFLVLWRRHGPYVQIMDPARGRRWLRAAALREELYIHEQVVPAAAWRAWAVSPEFLGSLIARLGQLRIPHATRDRIVRAAAADPTWRSLALLDAATRMVAELVRARGLRAGEEAAGVIDAVLRRAESGADVESLVPPGYWFVSAGDSPDDSNPDDSDNTELRMRGPVLLRVSGLAGADAPAASTSARGRRVASALASTMSDAPPRPLAEMWHLVCDGRPAVPALLAFGLFVAAAGALFEIMCLRGLLEMGHVLGLREQRLAGLGLLLGVVCALLVLDLCIGAAVLAIGRRIEARLRAAVLAKLPRLGDGYFQSRLVSDLAHRAHSLDALRGIPELGARFSRSAMQLVFTAMALAWLDPPSALIACTAAALGLAIPLATERILAERELRQRSHSAALTRHYLDSLLGLVPARMHAGERAVRYQHERLLVEWARSSLHLLRGGVVIDGVQLLVGSLLAAWLVLGFVSRGARPGSTLLLVYWTLTLPLLAREVAAAIRQFPAFRNILSRVLEPLRAPDESAAPDQLPVAESDSAAAITFASVQVRIRGRRVLDGVDLTIRPGEHVAVVGRSGAGKSTLAGLLLGWRSPSDGTVLVDGEPLHPHRLAMLRRATAWVDPSVHLWNQSLFDNLRYGDRGTIVSSIGSIIEEADLGEILEKLPAGLQSPLGEGGRLTSGGEGQRIRFGRALVRRPVRLAILDEPFRGLDRQRRHDLLVRAREIWRDTTMLCVTHDIEETLAFERVLVLDQGRIVEDGNPAILANDEESVYAGLMGAEHAVHTTLWADGRWRRWRLDGGVIAEQDRIPERAWIETSHTSLGR
jgi:ABC-type bacteriocin/lantibiotic exporter with double-glycine peptidase domain